MNVQEERRFRIADRVCCNRGELGWCVGSVQMVDEPDPENCTVLPYVVELDGTGKLSSVPRDAPECIVAEVCWDEDFAVSIEAPLPPQVSATALSSSLRFAVGDKCTCLVADKSGHSTEWVSGTITEVWAQREDWGYDERCAYAIKLDRDGSVVLAHRDEHSLVRDLQLQEPGPALRANSSRFGKRKRGDDGSWETIDHQTLKVRATRPPPTSQSLGTTSAPLKNSTTASASDDPGTEAACLMCGECACDL